MSFLEFFYYTVRPFRSLSPLKALIECSLFSKNTLKEKNNSLDETNSQGDQSDVSRFFQSMPESKLEFMAIFPPDSGLRFYSESHGIASFKFSDERLRKDMEGRIEYLKGIINIVENKLDAIDYDMDKEKLDLLNQEITDFSLALRKIVET